MVQIQDTSVIMQSPSCLHSQFTTINELPELELEELVMSASADPNGLCSLLVSRPDLLI